MSKRKFKYFYLGHIRLTDEKERVIYYCLDILEKAENARIYPETDIKNAMYLVTSSGLHYVRVHEDEDEVMYMFSDDESFMRQARFLSEEIYRI